MMEHDQLVSLALRGLKQQLNIVAEALPDLATAATELVGEAEGKKIMDAAALLNDVYLAAVLHDAGVNHE